MQTRQITLVNTVAYYDPLLQRYARRIIQNEAAAAIIVQEVLEAQFQINGLVPAKHLRQVLKTDVLNYCYYHIQAKMFDRPVIKIPLRNFLKAIESNEQAVSL